ADAPVGGGRTRAIARRAGARGVALEAPADAVAAQRPAEQLATVGGLAFVSRGHVPGGRSAVVREPELARSHCVVVSHQGDGDVARPERVLDQGTQGPAVVARLPAEPALLAPEDVPDPRLGG